MNAPVEVSFTLSSVLKNAKPKIQTTPALRASADDDLIKALVYFTINFLNGNGKAKSVNAVNIRIAYVRFEPKIKLKNIRKLLVQKVAFIVSLLKIILSGVRRAIINNN